VEVERPPVSSFFLFMPKRVILYIVLIHLCFSLQVIRCILRMYDVDTGSVMVDNIDVKSLYQQSLRSSIGVVAQDTVLFHASLRDNVSITAIWFFVNHSHYVTH
jgi:ABC-type transport system involved in Fe-S cluster assembly fused permease/ATPase subunit